MRIGCPIASILISQVFVVSFLSRKKAIAKQYRIVSACVQIHNIRIEHFFFQLNWHNRLPSHHISLLLWLFIAARMRKSISASECSPNFLFHFAFSLNFLCGVSVRCSQSHTHTLKYTHTQMRESVCLIIQKNFGRIEILFNRLCTLKYSIFCLYMLFFDDIIILIYILHCKC